MPDLLLSHILNYGKFSAVRNDYRAAAEFREICRIAKRNNATTATRVGDSVATYGSYMCIHNFEKAANELDYIKVLIKE